MACNKDYASRGLGIWYAPSPSVGDPARIHRGVLAVQLWKWMWNFYTPLGMGKKLRAIWRRRKPQIAYYSAEMLGTLKANLSLEQIAQPRPLPYIRQRKAPRFKLLRDVRGFLYLRRRLKVWALNECDWYAGEDLLAVVLAYMRDTGRTMSDESLDGPRALTPWEMRCYKYHDEDAKTLRSFRRQLDCEIWQQVRKGNAKAHWPCMFASTEC